MVGVESEVNQDRAADVTTVWGTGQLGTRVDTI